MNALWKTESNVLKHKYKSIIQKTVLPILDEILTCIGDTYGEETLNDIAQMIKENTL